MIQTWCLVLALAGNDLVPDARGKPAVTHVGVIAPDVIAITLRAQAVEHGIGEERRSMCWTIGRAR